MLYNNRIAAALVLSAATVYGASDDDSLTLSSSNVQIGSTVDGSLEVGFNDANEALSLTSNNNFINFCSGKTLTNGLQILTGSCNGIVMGDIPAKTAMVSSVILNPTTGDSIPSDTDFNITVQMANIVAGSFTNADATYYAAPQQLSNGQVIGHTHVTVQDLGDSLNPTQALDATQFAFFKGINDPGNGQGLLSATVAGGLPAGNYRVCTLASASNHQPVIMPVAQRGSSDDCTKFTVSGNGNTPNVASNDGSGGIAAAAAAAQAVENGPGAVDTSVASVAAASTSAAATSAAGSAQSTGSASSGSSSSSSSGNTGGNTGKGGNKFGGGSGKFGGGRFGGQHGGGRRHRFARRQYIA